MKQKRGGIKLSSYPAYHLEGKQFIGGNQAWFGADKKQSCVERYGCGLVAAADLLSCLLKNQYTVTEFLSFAQVLNRSYTRVRTYIGVNGYSLARGISSYAKAQGLNLRASWGVKRPNLLKRIYEMLESGIPVILGIGLDLRLFQKERGVWFYRKDADGYSICGEQGKVQGHYVTVTGIEEAGDEAQTIMLSIVSWGQEFYLDYQEYSQYVDAQPFGLRYILSNILDVKYNRVEK